MGISNILAKGFLESITGVKGLTLFISTTLLSLSNQRTKNGKKTKIAVRAMLPLSHLSNNKDGALSLNLKVSPLPNSKKLQVKVSIEIFLPRYMKFSLFFFIFPLLIFNIMFVHVFIRYEIVMFKSSSKSFRDVH